MLGEDHKLLLRNRVHNLPSLSAFLVFVPLQMRQESFTLLILWWVLEELCKLQGSDSVALQSQSLT